MDKKLLAITQETKLRFEKLGRMKDTHDSLLNRIVDFYEKNHTH